MIISFRGNGGGQGGGVTTGEVESMITSALSDYYTSGETDTAIDDAVSGKADSSAVTEEVASALSTALTDYYTTGQTDAAISDAIDSEVVYRKVATNNNEQWMDIYGSLLSFGGYIADLESVEVDSSIAADLALMYSGYTNYDSIYQMVMPYNEEVSVLLVRMDDPTDGVGARMVFWKPAYDCYLTLTQRYNEEYDFIFLEADEVYSFDNISQVDNKADSSAVTAAISTALAGYYTSGQTDSAISTALGAYWTSAETQTAINTALGTVNNQLESI